MLDNITDIVMAASQGTGWTISGAISTLFIVASIEFDWPIPTAIISFLVIVAIVSLYVRIRNGFR